MISYDVIILGAGISGLLLASELSKRFSVLIIEKQNVVLSRKYWLVDNGSIESNADLLACVDTKYSHMDFIAYDHTSYRCFGEYYLLDTNRTISYLLGMFNIQGGEVLTSHRFFGYKLSDDKITVFANEQEYSAKLVVDCMGYSSPIITAKQVVSIIGYYLIYGVTVKLKRPIEPVGLHNVLLESKPSFLEIFPTSQGKAHAILILPEKSIRKTTVLRDDLTFLLTKSRYESYVDLDFHSTEPLDGIIPIGSLRKRALNRVFFFGEAGQVNPATTATGLTRMLYKYKEIALFLGQRIKEDKLSERDLINDRVDCQSPYNRRLQANIFRDILKWSSDDFRDLVLEFNRIGNHGFVNDVMFGTFLYKKYSDMATLSKILHSGNKKISRSLIRSLIR